MGTGTENGNLHRNGKNRERVNFIFPVLTGKDHFSRSGKNLEWEKEITPGTGMGKTIFLFPSVPTRNV